MVDPKKQCTNCHGITLRCFIKPAIDGKQSWRKISWRYCPVCKMLLPD